MAESARGPSTFMAFMAALLVLAAMAWAIWAYSSGAARDDLDRAASSLDVDAPVVPPLDTPAPPN